MRITQFIFLEFCIGAGVHLTTPLLRKTPDPSTPIYRCLSLNLSLCGFMLMLTIPLWEEL